MSVEPPLPVLRAAIGTYPHTRALKSGKIASNLLTLDYASVTPVSRAFAPMVREQAFDVCEMAIATFLQAKAYGKPLVLLPVTLAARFQEQALLCLADSRITGPGDLAGGRVGVRAYSQTTGMWLRGILENDYGVAPGDIHWVTFEDAHTAEYRDPPFAMRASAGSDMLAMLRAGELDAVIVGNEVPGGGEFRTVFPDPAAAAKRFWDEHGFVPVNHVAVVTRALATGQPHLVHELYRMFGASRAAAGDPGSAACPIGRAALQPSIDRALAYCAGQELLPKGHFAGQIWDSLPEDLV